MSLKTTMQSCLAGSCSEQTHPKWVDEGGPLLGPALFSCRYRCTCASIMLTSRDMGVNAWPSSTINNCFFELLRFKQDNHEGGKHPSPSFCALWFRAMLMLYKCCKMLVYNSKYIRFVTDKMPRQFETLMRRLNCMWTKCMQYWMFDILGIWRSAQDTSICGCPCSGSGGWCYRGWPLWCPERIWWNQVTLKLCHYYELKKVHYHTGGISSQGFAFLLFFAWSYVVLMPKKRQALVEYADMNGSFTAVTYAADNQVYIAGHPAFINYSTSQKISRPGDSDDSRSVNNVLLFTIMNPIYPITTVNSDVIHWVFGVLHVASKLWYFIWVSA